MADISVLQKNSFRHAYNSGVLEQLVYDVWNSVTKFIVHVLSYF
jgi:hypothetical protein